MSDDLLAQAAARAITYLRERDAQPVFPGRDAVEGLSALVEPLPDGPTDAVDVIELLDEVVGPATVATTGGRYFGFVTGGAHPVGLAAAWLAAAWDQNAAVGVMSPGAAVLDTIAGSWALAALGLPPTAQATFVGGTSIANATCLAAARDRLHADAGWDSVADGLYGAPPIRVVVSEAAHSSVTKALGFIGLGRERVVAVPADDQGRLRAEALPAPGEPTLVITQAGNVNTGSFDPFVAIADHFDDSPVWIHVDGAFGLWAGASPARRHLVNGVERAHSWATDLHKWPNTTYDNAIAVVAESADLARTFQVGASYIPDGSRLDPLHRGPDMSQRARAVEAWAVMKSLGRTGLADVIDRTCDHAARLAAAVSEAGVEVVNDVVLNQVLLRLDDDDATERLLAALGEGSTMWAGGSAWEGRPVIRISVSSWATTDDDIDRAIATIVQQVSPTFGP